MAKPKTPNNPKGAGAPKKPPTVVVSQRVAKVWEGVLREAIKKEMQRLISQN